MLAIIESTVINEELQRSTMVAKVMLALTPKGLDFQDHR